MVGTLQPLDGKFAVVDEQGNPTEYFTRWAQQRQIDIGEAISLEQLQAYLATISMIAGSGLTGGGDISATRTFTVGAGTGITVNSDDVAIDLTAEAERIRDVVGATLVAGANITITVDDALNTITVAVSGISVYTDAQAIAAVQAVPTTTTGTTYTLALIDGGGYRRLTNAAGCAVTVPPNASVAFPLGATITLRTTASAASSIVPGAGVTINKVGGGTGTQLFAEIGATAQVKKVGTNEWDLIGGLA